MQVIGRFIVNNDHLELSHSAVGAGNVTRLSFGLRLNDAFLLKV